MVSKYKLHKLGYALFEEESKLIAIKMCGEITLFIIIRNNSIVNYYLTNYIPISTQKDIDRLQIAYNILQSDIKEIRNGN